MLEDVRPAAGRPEFHSGGEDAVMAYRDPAIGRMKERERSAMRAAERAAKGTCSKCGQVPAAPRRRLCEACLAKRREADRIRYRKAKAAGLIYGGRDPAGKRKSARAASKRRRQTRVDAGRCTRCGRRPPADGGTTCGPCRLKRQSVEREQYAERRAAGLCIRCGGAATGGGSRCAPCAVLEAESRPAEQKNAAARRKYAARRSCGECTDCGAVSHGAARCGPCARRSYERSGQLRGMPVYPPSYTVIEIGTGECHGTYDSEAEVAACLLFARLSPDEVEVIADTSVMNSLTSW